jgi:acyl dehydratase
MAADAQVGTKIPPFTMDDITMPRIEALMELMNDVNPVHDDPDVIARRGLRGPVNQGPANLAYIVNMLTLWAGPEMELERFDFRFLDTVAPGDTVVARGVVTGVEVSAGRRRIACQVWLERDGVRAVDGTATIAVPVP